MAGSAAGRLRSFGAHLAAFALAVALPVTVLAGALLWHSVDVARAQTEARLMQLAAALARDIERDVERHILVLNTLTSSVSFVDDWAAFHARARRALQGDGYIVVVDAELYQLVNTVVPYGSQPERTGDPVTAQRVLASKRPEVSDVFTSLVTGGPVINVDMPVLQDGEVAYILMYGRPIHHLDRLLEGQSLDRGWSSAVFDRQGTLITSYGADERSNERPPGAAGVSRYRDVNGEPTFRATHVSEATGWTVTVDVPAAVAMREVNAGLRWWGLFALATVMLALALGLTFGRYLRRQLHAAAEYARAVGREQEAPPLAQTSLREVAEIGAALEKTRGELARRMEQQKLLSRELSHRVKNLLSVVQAMVQLTFASKSEAGEARDRIMQRLQSLARSQDLLTRSDWTALPLRRLVEAETAPFAERISFEGPDLSVSAANVQNFGLVLHELTTNAVKYGALREGAGKVAVRWSVEDGAGGKRFKFRWKESCVPADGAGEESGFGSTLLKRAFRGADSVTRLEIEPDGLVYELEAALETVTGNAEAAAASESGASATAAA